MGYIANDTLTIDAILTRRGRELLSQSNFKITKFSVSDDEVDYRLYNNTSNSGSSHYADAITSMPVLQAITDETKLMKYKLVNANKGQYKQAIVSIGATTIRVPAITTSHPTPWALLEVVPSTSNGNNDTYTMQISDDTYLGLYDNEGNLSGKSSTGPSFMLRGKTLPAGQSSVTVQGTITGNDDGGVINFSILVYDKSSQAGDILV
jgi:hypothetical protein